MEAVYRDRRECLNFSRSTWKNFANQGQYLRAVLLSIAEPRAISSSSFLYPSHNKGIWPGPAVSVGEKYRNIYIKVVVQK
jgi:hypothetical protein